MPATYFADEELTTHGQLTQRDLGAPGRIAPDRRIFRMMLATLRCDSLHPEAPVLYGSGTGGRMTRVGSLGGLSLVSPPHLLDRSAESEGWCCA
jgi:hypothetical protein